MDFLKDLSIDKVRNIAEDAFNQAKPKTEVEARVYEVLSHKNWGSSSTLLNEIARDTFDYDKFAVISQLMWEAMENQRPAAWRIVFKGLTLLEHLIKNGSERCVDDARNHGRTLRALHKFNYYEGTVDRGLGVREKSKQLVDILGDDERVREERMKSRKMREKLGKLGGVSGGSTSGGGGGGGSYAGYGNDNWNSGSGSAGGGGGYGNGGIGSSDTRRAGGTRGRYDEDRATDTRASEPTPTFAALPEEPKRSKKNKKKKQPAAAAEPEVDLFAFDAPAPAAAAAADEFDAFQSAGGDGATTSTPDDPFATPAPAQQFDAFGGQPQQQQQNSTAQFDAFGAAGQQQKQQFGAFAGSSGGQPQQQAQPNAQFDAFGGAAGAGTNQGNNMAFAGSMMAGGAPTTMNPGMQQQQQPMMGGNVMGGGGNNTMRGNGMGASAPAATAEDDDFGDFAGASAKSAVVSQDPLSKLISLDGLSKNQKQQESKLNQPIIANAAAATFVQEKDQIQAAVKQSNKGSSMSFAGIDGLHKSSSGGGMAGSGMMMMSPGMTMPSNPNVMGGGMGADAISSMMDPSSLSSASSNQTQRQQQGNQQQMMMGAGNPQMMSNPQQMMGNQQQMMRGQMMGAGSQQMMGAGNPQMMSNQMGGGGQMMGNQMGGMMQGGMMMTPQQQQQMMMMNNQGMQQGSHNMQSGMQGKQNNMMGGQPMGGFR